MITFEINGLFTDTVANKVAELMNGATYMNFKVEVGGMRMNRSIIVTTEYEATVEDAREFFIYTAFNKFVLG